MEWRVVFLLVGLIALAGPAGADAGSLRVAADPGMFVTFQVGDTFSVTLADGTPIGATTGSGAVIPAGSYQLFLNDTSGAIQQFDLSGPGVSLVTNMTNAEDLAASYVETFQPNSTYTYRDDYHPGTIWTFTTSSTIVGETPSTTTSTTTSTTPAASPPTPSSPVGVGRRGQRTDKKTTLGTLEAVVAANGSLGFTFDGKPVGSLRAGRYRIEVVDRSKKSSFFLQKVRSAAIAVSGGVFVGRRTLTVSLTTGQWMFYAALVGRKHFFIVES